ncbi:MAG TPA: hypothetical protein VGP06_06985 [Janthinobacterium sp.]|nr:hypothetical protein [Janthinobacterium sp.]
MRQLLERALAAPLLDWYTDAAAAVLWRSAGTARADAAGNSYGESVLELALSLLYELQAQPSYWDGFLAAVAGEHARSGEFWAGAGADAILRKKINDMFVGLRDKVDADNYQVTLGQACSPNKMYTYRMLDTAYGEIAALFAGWREHEEQVAAILGRAPGGLPIEARQMKAIAGCKAEWVIRWSETLERFSGSPGPLHTRSKRFASLKNSPEKIAAMMAEIGDYEELSSNLDRADDWSGDAGEAALWLEDYWRVLGESEAAQDDGGTDRILAPAPELDEFEAFEAVEAGLETGAADADAQRAADGATPHQAARDEALAAGLSLPPRFIELATAAQDGASWTLRMLKDDTLAIRLAVYHKMLGSADDSYPDAWCDPATSALPTLQQLAALDGISMPTLRKRRNDAIARLQSALAASGQGGDMKENE